MDKNIQNVEPTPEHLKELDPAECPTCVSGLEPTVIGNGLFHEALLDSL